MKRKQRNTGEKWKERTMHIAKQKIAEEEAHKEKEKANAEGQTIAEEVGSKRETSNRRLTQLLTFQRKCSASGNRRAKKAHLEDETGQNFKCRVCFTDNFTEGDK